MLLAGDEFGRTQRGNNNAYCQDNATSWVDWSLLERNAGLFAFTQRLIRFRKAHPALRRRTFFEDEEKPLVAWHGTKLGKPDWTGESRALGMHLLGAGGDDPIYLIDERPLGGEGLRAAEAPRGDGLAALPGHEPSARRGRARAGRRGPGPGRTRGQLSPDRACGRSGAASARSMRAVRPPVSLYGASSNRVDSVTRAVPCEMVRRTSYAPGGKLPEGTPPT